MDQSSKSKTRFKWGSYGLEFLSILLGVLVALAVDEWNEDRENSDRAELAISNIRLEMMNNKKMLDALHENNTTALEVLIENDTTKSDSLTILPGLQLQETAWRTVMGTGIAAHIPYSQLYEFAEHYTIIKIYKDMGYRFLDNFMQVRNFGKAMGNEISDHEAIRSNLTSLGLMVSIEEQLMININGFLDDSLDTQ